MLIERLANRRVLAVITGHVFDDVDHSLRQEPGESDLASRLVYLDNNLNGTLDGGEAFAIAGDDGGFQFENIPDGEYSVRLYDGSTTQQQVFPVDATPVGLPVVSQGGQQLVRIGQHSFAMTADSVVVGDVLSGQSRTAILGDSLGTMQALPDGSVMVTRTSGEGNSAFLVELDGNLSSVPTSTPWSDLAVGEDGTGVLLPLTGEDTVEFTLLDASEPAEQISFVPSGIEVPSDAQVIGSVSGNRSIFAWAGDSGLAFSLWSNSTASWISDAPVEVSGTTQLLDFDDASGLLAVRNADGGVNVQDVDSQFATLVTLAELDGPVVIDGTRELLMTVAPDSAILELYDLRNGSQVAEMPVDFTNVGDVAAMTITAVESGPPVLTVLGSKGSTEIALSRPAAHSVTVRNGTDPKPVQFGVQLLGDNTPPPMPAGLSYETVEDQSIADQVPGVLRGLVDAESDLLVALPIMPSANGSVSLDVSGAFQYRPAQDFFGSDQFSFLIHDGRTASEAVGVPLTIMPLPDPPTDIEADLIPIAEDALINHNLGPVTVIDADLNDNFDIVVSDDRFEVQNGNLIFVGGELDYEYEDYIPLTIFAIDSESQSTYSEEFEIYVLDRNDPITAIHPDNASVDENEEGVSIATLAVSDDDAGRQQHVYLVDDDRFEIFGSDLRLKSGLSLDFESEPQITVNITAIEVGDSNTLTEPLVIHVTDIAEAVGTIELAGDSVIEFAAGAAVGLVSLNGNPVTSNYRLSVDDERFEIVDSTLKLLDDTWVRRADVEEIEVTIVAQDIGEEFLPASQTFVIRVVENPSPFHNDDNPYDVDTGGYVSALDALMIINHLNDYGPGPIGNGDPGIGYDVNSDGWVTALDALLVINELNHIHNGGGSTVGGESPEGESVETEPVPDDPDGNPVADATGQDDESTLDDSIVEDGGGITPDDDYASESSSQSYETDNWDSAIIATTEAESDEEDTTNTSLDLFSDEQLF